MRPILLAAAVLLLTSTGQAQSNDPLMDSEVREEAAIERISAALPSGRVSLRERQRLDRLFQRLDRLQHAAIRDGVLHPSERRRLDRLQDEIDRMITRALAH